MLLEGLPDVNQLADGLYMIFLLQSVERVEAVAHLVHAGGVEVHAVGVAGDVGGDVFQFYITVFQSLRRFGDVGINRLDGIDGV